MAKKKTLKKKTAAKSSSKIEQLTDPVLDSARDIVRAGLGAFAMAQKESGKVVEQGSALFDKLVAEGARLEKEGKTSLDAGASGVQKGAKSLRNEVESRLDAARQQAEDRWDKLESVFEERVSRVMGGLGVPTADDLNRLSAQVESLSRKVAALSGGAADTQAPSAPEEEETVYHLVPHDEGWAIRKENAKRNLSLHDTKREALDAGRDVAQAHEPSRLVVHKADGTIQTSYSYGED